MTNNIIDRLSTVFLTLKNVSMHIQDDPMPDIKEYDIVFSGPKFNMIDTAELYHILEDRFQISISNDDFQNLVPAVCDKLFMSYEKLLKVNDLPNSNLYSYRVQLW